MDAFISDRQIFDTLTKNGYDIDLAAETLNTTGVFIRARIPSSSFLKKENIPLSEIRNIRFIMNIPEERYVCFYEEDGKRYYLDIDSGKGALFSGYPYFKGYPSFLGEARTFESIEQIEEHLKNIWNISEVKGKTVNIERVYVTSSLVRTYTIN